jgi:sulfate/thiosulfate transport system permease protein
MPEKTPRTFRQYLLVGIVVLYAALLLIAPMTAIVANAFKDGIQPVIEALTSEDVVSALRVTLSLVVSATIINTIAGVALAWVLVRHEFPGKHLVDAMVDLPFVVSPVIIGYVIIVLFGRNGWFEDFPVQIAFSWPGMLLVTVFVSLPFVTREVMPVLAAMTPQQEEAAYTLGASPILTFRRIVLPTIWRGILYGVVLTLARALGEFGAVAVAGGGVQGVTETATIYIFRAMLDRDKTGAYSLAILLGLISVVILLGMNALRAPTTRRS